jgi:hypothetical protein
MTAADSADTTPNVGDFQLFRYEGGATTITSNCTSPSFTSGEYFHNPRINQEPRSIGTAVTVTLGGTGADDFVAAVNACRTDINNVSATKLTQVRSG